MGIVFRQSIKSTILLFSGAVLGALINYFYTFAMDKPEIGLLTNILSVAAIFQIITMMGFNAVMLIFPEKLKNDLERKSVLITVCILAPIFFTVLLSLPLFFLKAYILRAYHGEDLIYMDKFYSLIPLLAGLWGLMSVLEQYLFSQLLTAKASFNREILYRLINLALIGLLFMKVLSFSLFMVLNVVLYIIPIIVLFSFGRKTKGFYLNFNFKVFSKKEYMEIAHFSWYHLLIGVSLTVMGFIDMIMLGALDTQGLSSLAVYRFVTFIAAISVMPYKVMTTATLPVLNRAYVEKNTEELADLFKRSALNIFIVGIFLIVVIACNLQNVVLILPPGYDQIVPATLIILLGKMIDMSTGMNSDMLSISTHYKITFWLSIFFVVVMVSLNFILIPTYGVFGAAWSATIALLLFNVAKYIIVYRLFSLQPFSAKTLVVLGAGVVSCLVGYFIPHFHSPILDTLYRSIVISICFLALLIATKPSEDLTKYLNSVIKDKRLF